MCDARTSRIPLILETPPKQAAAGAPKKAALAAEHAGYRREIALLYALAGTSEGDPVDAALLKPRKAAGAGAAMEEGEEARGSCDEEESEEEVPKKKGKAPASKAAGKAAAKAPAPAAPPGVAGEESAAPPKKRARGGAK